MSLSCLTSSNAVRGTAWCAAGVSHAPDGPVPGEARPRAARRTVRRAWLAAAAAMVMLAACGKKEDTPAASSAPGAAASPAASASAPLQVAFAYVGPVGDGGWSFAHDNARKAVEKEFGDRIKTTFVEKVPEGGDAEHVFRDLVQQGNTLVFGTTFGYMEPMLKVAADSPHVKFEHATGYKQSANMRTYDSRTYEGAYLAGVVAGAMTKSNRLGVVGSIPIPEVIRNINSFALGARSTNPKATVTVVWVNEWFNPPQETNAAQTLINAGADVLMQNTDSSAVLQTAEKNGKYAFGWDSDMSSYGPKAHLASAVVNWAPYYSASIKAVLDGTWSAGPGKHSWWGVKEGAIDLVALNDVVPAEVKARVEKVKAGLKDGSFVIWKGPVVGQDGQVMLAKDQVADDNFLQGLKSYVQGVEGQAPSGK